MKSFPLILFVALLWGVSSCERPEMDVISDDSALKSAQAVLNFQAHLSGMNEVPPVETDAVGQVVFQLSKDGNTLRYKLIVDDIVNVTAAHIHLAPAGSNGGVVLWLYPSASPGILIPGETEGILAQGTRTSANLVGALVGKTMADLISQIENGNAYVNVHTTAKPGGEIRGQIK